MGRLIKYDLKGSFKKFSILIIIMSIINIAILLKANPNTMPMWMGVMPTVNFAANFIVLVLCINDFEKELYEERAYLTFTLPVKGRDIIGSKLITTFIWLIITGIISAIFIFMLIGQNKEVNLTMIKFNLDTVTKIIIFIVFMIINTSILICLAYFAAILPRIPNINVKIGKFLGGIIFIALMVALVYIDVKIIDLFPQEMVIGKNLDISIRTIVNTDSGNFIITGESIILNIASTIYSLVLFVGLFISNSYLIENKLDIR